MCYNPNNQPVNKLYLYPMAQSATTLSQKSDLFHFHQETVNQHQ